VLVIPAIDVVLRPADRPVLAAQPRIPSLAGD